MMKIARLVVVGLMMASLAFAGGAKEAKGEKGKTEMVVWTTISKDNEAYPWFADIIKNYETEHPELKIFHEEQPSNEMAIMMQTLLAARRGPDVMEYWEGMYLFPVKDYLNDLKELLSKEQIDIFSSTYNITGYYKYDVNEKLLGLPFTSAGFFFWMYNKAMFRDAGITFEPTPANQYRMSWDEFIGAAEKLKAAGYTPIGWGNEGGYMTSWYFDPVSKNYFERDDWLRLMDGQLKWNDPKYLESITRINELVKAGYFNEGGLTTGWTEGLNLVKNRKVAMSGAFWSLNNKATWEELKDDFGMMQWPIINRNNPLAYSLDACVPGRLLIPVWSKIPKIAADFIYNVNSKENSQKRYEATGGFVPRKDFDPSIIPDTGFGKYERLAWQWLTSVETFPSVQNVSWPTEVFYEQAGKSVELFSGKITEKEFLDALQTRFEQLDYEWITNK